MAKMKYNPGDLVQLKAGGPKMVIEQFLGYADAYECTWFAGAKHNQQQFKEEALQKWVDEE